MAARVKTVCFQIIQNVLCVKYTLIMILYATKTDYIYLVFLLSSRETCVILASNGLALNPERSEEFKEAMRGQYYTFFEDV